MALTQDISRTYELGDVNEFPVAASTKVYEGAAVGLTSGNARGLNAGDLFVGFAEYQADNSSGGAGAINVRVKSCGLIQLPVTSVAATDVGKPVYASDDGTFVLTSSTNSPIGRVHRYVSSGIAIVAFDASRAGLGGQVTVLTDSTGGTADNTLAAVGATNGSDVSAAINNNFADLAAKVNAILKQLG